MMRSPQARRAHQPFVDVQEPGKGKALLHVLADGRSTGHYRLSERLLDKVRISFGHCKNSHTNEMRVGCRLYFKMGDHLCLPQVPEVWQGSSASDRDDGKWWEAVDTVALDLSHNKIRFIPAEINELSKTLETLNLWCA